MTPEQKQIRDTAIVLGAGIGSGILTALSLKRCVGAASQFPVNARLLARSALDMAAATASFEIASQAEARLSAPKATGPK